MNGKRMPSPALVISVAALFVSLSGTAIGRVVTSSGYGGQRAWPPGVGSL